MATENINKNEWFIDPSTPMRDLAQMLVDTPEVIEADRVTGEDCFLAKVVVSDLHELETVIDRFVPFSSTDTAIIQSSTVVRRLPKL